MGDAIPTPSTVSTTAIYATFRAAIAEYVRPTDNVTLDQLLETNALDRIHVRAAPGRPQFPYITLRLSTTTLGAYNGYRQEGILEVQVVGKPESQLPLVEAIADLINGCFLGYKQPNSGLIFSRQSTRTTIPQFTDPADMNVVCEQLQFDVTLWPKLLTDLRPN